MSEHEKPVDDDNIKWHVIDNSYPPKRVDFLNADDEITFGDFITKNDNALDKYTIPYTPPAPPEPFEWWVADENGKQWLLQEWLLPKLIQAIRENPAIAREFWLALLAVLPKSDPFAPRYRDDALRGIISAALGLDGDE